MPFLMTVIGAIAGAWLASTGKAALGIGAGAVIGYLLARIRRLQDAVRLLHDDVREVREQRSPALPAATADVSDPPQPSRAATPPQSPTPRVAAATAAPAVSSAAVHTTPRSQIGQRLAGLWRVARRWITTGNVPVKVGVIISFFGVAFLLKYTVDRNILVFPIELRLLSIAAIACALLAFGWRLRQQKAVYALSLQGGGIGILYLTIFAAMRLYALLPAGLAFLLLVVLTAAVGVLAVVQEARALAILATVGGFLAPVLTSTGQGSHVALFSYYLLLNAAILGISWFRAWRGLNLIGFAFTFGIGTAWGYANYEPALYAGTQPFLILYFLFYQAIAVLFAFRQPPKLRGLVDGSLLFGTPVVAFALQSRLVGDSEYGLAISAAAVAVFYVLLATWLYRKHRALLRLLVESYVALATAFATIAIPLALDARWTAAAWSLEGAALVWVGIRQHGTLARLAGIGLLFASGAAFIEAGWESGAGMAVLNGNCLGGALISAAAFFAALRLHRDPRPLPMQGLASAALLTWSLLWWFVTGGQELGDRLVGDAGLHGFLLFAAASSAALSRGALALQWRLARLANLAFLPLLVVYAVGYLFDLGHWFAGFGGLSWTAAIAAQYYVLWLADDGLLKHAGRWHAATCLFLAAGLALEAAWRIEQLALRGVWSESAALLVLALAGGAVMHFGQQPGWPWRAGPRHYRGAAGALLCVVLAFLIAAGIDSPGSAAPLPYLPVVNPLDALTLLGLLLAVRYLLLLRATGGLVAPESRAWAGNVLGATAFLLTTIALVRGVYHFSTLQWSAAALSGSVTVQAALSIYWGILGFAGMVLGTRRSRRKLWLLGTAMMALVVVKLFLVDLGNTGTVARIVSFMGVGALLLVVGYFAPAPPRPAAPAEEQ